MSGYVCGRPHIGEPDMLCNRTKKNHPMHSAYSIRREKYISWANDDYQVTDADKKRVQKEEDNAEATANRKTLKTLAANLRRQS